VLLIDEIDKADIRKFPTIYCSNSIAWNSVVYETVETIKAAVRPIVMITSQQRKELPDAFCALLLSLH